MKILIAPDKMKGSISAADICDIIEEELLNHKVSVDIIKCPLADGGDGTMDVIHNHIELRPVYVGVQDPLRRNIEAYYCVNGNDAYVELSIASGLALLQDGESNPMVTSTYGTGQLIRHAIQQGCETIYLMLGGSCTNDVGIGILSALGYRFLDQEQHVIDPVGQNLILISTIDNGDVIDLSPVKFKILCDVNNPLYGDNGAAHIFGEQKGADANERNILDTGMQHFATIVKEHNGVNIQSIIGGGAAGGIAAGLYGFCDAEILSGFDTLSELVNLEKLVKKSDIIICGEGRLDDSSFDGKVVGGIYKLCERYNKPLHLMVGQNSCSDDLISDKNINVMTLDSYAQDTADAQNQVIKYLREMCKDFIRDILLS